MGEFVTRAATLEDLAGIRALMDRAIGELQAPFLTPEQIHASRESMGVDTRLIADGTYFLVEDDGLPVGCGGWSRRATLYGGDHAAALRDDRLLDPCREPARVRAMYTHPSHARRGIGRLILGTCEAAARAAGFTRVELMATLAGEPLYTACGYRLVRRVERLSQSGVPLPGAVMAKDLA